MKKSLWIWQIPVILLATWAYSVTELGVQGRLENEILRNRVFPKLREFSAIFTDLKFRMRGPIPPKNKIVIVEVDSPSIEALGRWPWHRDMIALIIDTIFSYGAKAVGLDMVFSESDRRIPEELSSDPLTKDNYGLLLSKYETDPRLTEVISKYRDRLVLGWSADQFCQPLYDSLTQECPVIDPAVLDRFPKGFEKFGFSVQTPASIDVLHSPLPSIVTFLSNLDDYNAVAAHEGHFNAITDPDGKIRRGAMVFLASSRSDSHVLTHAYPALPLEMARVGLNEDLEIQFDPESRIDSMRFVKSGNAVPVSPVGAVEMNFRGPDHSFPYFSVMDLLRDNDPKDPSGGSGGRTLANVSKAEIFRDAYVLLGVSAVGVYDMRAFPFADNVPGVEGHATLLDNILSNDYLTEGHGLTSSRWVYFLMIVGGLLFAAATERLDAVPALIFSLSVFAGVGGFDLKVLFSNNIQWNTSFLLTELTVIFFSTIAAKYVIEEKNKRFLRGAFAKYVAPAVVDSILKDPGNLRLGGEKRELTVLFSDIRGFTSFSEVMDAKALAAFLNDYLSIQTEIVFDHQGTLDKYIGDAIMAFWGAPLDQPKHSANACIAAIKMMQALESNKKRFKDQHGVEVQIGIGINSGTVNVGNMGSNKNFAYTVIGDHVNLASRLEGLTKYYGVGILASRFTLDMIKREGCELPPHRVLDHVKVKGKKNAVELVQILHQDYPACGLELFEKARVLYTQQKWNEAETAFREANALLQGGLGPAPAGVMDGPVALYLERIAEFKLSPPSKDWDGAWEMHSK